MPLLASRAVNLSERQVYPLVTPRLSAFRHAPSPLCDQQRASRCRSRYICWHLQRRMRQMETVPHGTYRRTKQTVTAPIDSHNWLHKHGRTP